MSTDRRKFLGAALASTATGLTLGASSMARAAASKESFNLKMTNAYPPGAPFYVQGPGSPMDFCKKVSEMSGGRLNIQHFAAGELIPALEGFNAVSSGTVEMNAANAYFWPGRERRGYRAATAHTHC
jgi:TRAP-type mannitol/chloroaromatic compound transport system substrate-binding protein